MQRGGISARHGGRLFSWARLEPREGEFDFGWLDEVLDLLHADGVRVDLATATASPPPWLAHRHPETLPVTEDGVRLVGRQPAAVLPEFARLPRRAAGELVSKIAERYADHPALAMWHINNEYGCHVSHCYCEVSAAAFRAWLEARYGTVDELNRGVGHGVLVAALRHVRRGAAAARCADIRQPDAAARLRPVLERRAARAATGRRRRSSARASDLRSPPTSWASSSLSTTGRGRQRGRHRLRRHVSRPRRSGLAARTRRWCATSCGRSATASRGSSWSSRRAP